MLTVPGFCLLSQLPMLCPLVTSSTQPVICNEVQRSSFILGGFTVRLMQCSGHYTKFLVVRASAHGNEREFVPLSWRSAACSINRVSERFLSSFSDSLKEETGFDLRYANAKAYEFIGGIQYLCMKGEEAFGILKSDSIPEFLAWHRLEQWKNVRKWKPKRFGALLVYILVLIVSCQKAYLVFRSSQDLQRNNELTEAYLEEMIPDPSPSNIKKFKQGLWRKAIPKGLVIRKFVEGPDGVFFEDNEYVGKHAWEDDNYSSTEISESTAQNDAQLNPCHNEEQNAIIGRDSFKEISESTVQTGARLNPCQNEDLNTTLGSAEVGRRSKEAWRERLQKWKDILDREMITEQMDIVKSKYVVDFDMEEVKKCLHKEVAEGLFNTWSPRAQWTAKRWWLYRPRLPYLYFLQKLVCSEVAALAFSDNFKKLYVTMKAGFPLEYVVDVPMDPYLFEAINISRVEVDFVQGKPICYLLKMILAFVPGIVILWAIQMALMILLIASSRLVYKKSRQLIDMAHSENFFMPIESMENITLMYKEVILGSEIWDLLDELMTYMKNPLQFYQKEVSFVRGVLLSGPPGTGKTLFARILAKECGIPFVFASGAEFADSEKSGAAKINELFSIARRNAPSFIFIDEIDAVAGRYARADPQRRAAFDALITQLDGEREYTGVDRHSLEQAVIFLCATNRPDELDADFVRLGRIDRRIYIGLPNAKQRIQIFDLHSAGKHLAEDVDFKKLILRTEGFSGADIRHLVNEAAIMSVRKGHSLITQQEIIDVLDKQLLEGLGVMLTEDEVHKIEKSVSPEKKKLLAIHEAGHVLLAHLFPWFDLHAFSQLLPGGKETSISIFHPQDGIIDQGCVTFGYLIMHMVVAHGGRCAEHVVFGGSITDEGRDDLEKITKFAREMVISPSNSRLGLACLTRRIERSVQQDDTDNTFMEYKWDDPHVILADMSLELSELFTRELTRYIEETEEMAMDGLTRNRHILDAIADVLLENLRITEVEVKGIMNELSPVMFEDLGDMEWRNLSKVGPPLDSVQMLYHSLDIYPAPLHRC